MYRLLLKPILFLFDPEKTHHFVINATKLVFKIPGIPWIFRKIFQVNHKNLERNLFGLHFDNPVGLAAGFDKDAKFVAELASMGFGFIEIGTITPKAQPGNARPRLFRLPVDCALINRMGFNNAGVDAAVKRLKNGKFKVIIGGNIGKNKVTPNESAASDYLACFNALFPVVDYFVVNVSSPNTPDLRQLQQKEPLMALLQEIQLENNKKLSPKPVLLKIAPDLNNEQLDDIVDIVKQEKLSGIIATNTTISRDNLNTSKGIVERMGMGGLSGLPLKDRSTEVITYLHNRSKGQIPIIAVGGIFSGADAWQKLQAGASLVQVYTGFIYQGPHIVKEINNYILKQLQD